MKNLRLFELFAILILLASACSKKDAKSNEKGGPSNTSLITSIPCIQASLARNIIAFYPFSHGSLLDESGNKNHLSNSTNAKSTTDRNGNVNCSFEFTNFPNSVDYISTAKSDFLNNLDQFSISLWYMPKEPFTLAGLTKYECLIGRGDLGLSCPDKNGEWSLGLYDCRKAVFGKENSVWEQDILNDSNNCEREIRERTNLWRHVVATYNAKGKVIEIYINGVLHGVRNGVADCGSTPTSSNDIGDLFLGKYFTGVIDDVIIFNKVLSNSEVKEVYKISPCCLIR